MPRVSLILPMIPGDPRPEESRVAAFGAALRAVGHEVEVIAATGPGVEPAEGPGLRPVAARDPGLASAAMAGLEASSGEILVVIDPRMGYSADSVLAVVAPLAQGRADLVVGSRRIGGLLGHAIRPLTGTTDPLTGLIGVTAQALGGSRRLMMPVGGKIGLELLSKVEGRRLDVPALLSGPPGGRRPGWDDLRHLKRLADHRFGNVSRLAQYCVVGASGMVVDLSCYFAFQSLLRGTRLEATTVPPTRVTMALALARTSAIAVALAWNFALNRRLTFSYARSGSLPRQFAAYAASNLLGVLVSLALSLGLPSRVPFFRAHKLSAAVVGIVAATGISFSMSRWVVFRRRPDADSSADSPSPAAADGPPRSASRVLAAGEAPSIL